VALEAVDAVISELNHLGDNGFAALAAIKSGAGLYGQIYTWGRVALN